MHRRKCMYAAEFLNSLFCGSADETALETVEYAFVVRAGIGDAKNDLWRFFLSRCRAVVVSETIAIAAPKKKGPPPPREKKKTKKKSKKNEILLTVCRHDASVALVVLSFRRVNSRAAPRFQACEPPKMLQRRAWAIYLLATRMSPEHRLESWQPTAIIGKMPPESR